MKIHRTIFICAILITLILGLSVTTSAEATCTDCTTVTTAAPTPTNTPTVEPNIETWDTGEEFVLDLTVFSEPNEWSQALAKGVVVDEAGTICHPFRKGAYGWTGSIYHLVDGGWVALPTTLGYIPDDEGVYSACAYAPAPGIYSFFGYYPQK